MTYNTVAKMANDYDLRLRVAACAATEGNASPVSWAESHMWNIVGAAGWAAAWESALANDKTDLGKLEGVITDGMIIAAVQPLLGAS